MERNRTANLIAMIVAAILMVVLIVGHVRANQSQIFRMPEDGQLLTASVQGRNGPVEVEVAAGPTAFYRVKILSHEETEGIGTLAVDAIPNTIMETQRLDFDAVSGATITSEAIRSAVASALESGGIDPAAFGYVAPIPAPEKEEAPKPAAAPAAAAGGAYVPGTYTAEATGMGTVKVSVTVDENAITEVVLDTAGETPEIGGAATEELTSQVMAAQGPAIDGVSGATLTSNAVSTAVADALAQAAAAPAENETAGTEPASEPEETAEPEAAAKPEETAEPEAAEPETAAAAAADVPDGAQTLKGSGLGKVGDVDVEVVADENTIYSITVVKHDETPGIGTVAVDQIPAAIVEAQSLQVDAIAGATMTTDAIKEAVAAALVSGGIDASKFEKAVEAAAEPKEKTPETLDCDIVVVGAGGAGLTAAVRASQEGAKVLVLEKMPMVGGNSNRAEGGMNAAGTKLEEELGLVDSTVENFIADTLRLGHDLANPDLVRTLSENSSDAVEWLKTVGAEFTDVHATGGCEGRKYLHQPEGGRAVGEFLVEKLSAAAKEQGVDIMLNTKATEILMECRGCCGRRCRSCLYRQRKGGRAGHRWLRCELRDDVQL